MALDFFLQKKLWNWDISILNNFLVVTIGRFSISDIFVEMSNEEQMTDEAGYEFL